MSGFLSSGLRTRLPETGGHLAIDLMGRTCRALSNRATGGLFRAFALILLLLAPMQNLAQPRLAIVPFRYVNSFILVDAKIDGTPVRLLLDTGANKTIVNAKSFCRVEMNVSKPVNRGAGIVGNALRLRVDLEIAHQFLFSQPVAVMDLEELSKRFGIQFDGLLGQDVLNQFHAVRIDYKKQVIELEP